MDEDVYERTEAPEINRSALVNKLLRAYFENEGDDLLTEMRMNNLREEVEEAERNYEAKKERLESLEEKLEEVR